MKDRFCLPLLILATSLPKSQHNMSGRPVARNVSSSLLHGRKALTFFRSQLPKFPARVLSSGHSGTFYTTNTAQQSHLPRFSFFMLWRNMKELHTMGKQYHSIFNRTMHRQLQLCYLLHLTAFQVYYFNTSAV